MSDGIVFIDDISPSSSRLIREDPPAPSPTQSYTQSPPQQFVQPPFNQPPFTQPQSPFERDAFQFPASFNNEDNYPPREYFMGPLPARSPPPNTTVIQQPPSDNNFLLKAEDSLNCISVANHIKQCPVCSQLHKSNSHIFMGIIIALIILALFLGRRFFE